MNKESVTENKSMLTMLQYGCVHYENQAQKTFLYFHVLLSKWMGHQNMSVVNLVQFGRLALCMTFFYSKAK
jgi:hypothetical protein